MEMRGSPVPTFQIIIRLSLPGGRWSRNTDRHPIQDPVHDCFVLIYCHIGGPKKDMKDVMKT